MIRVLGAWGRIWYERWGMLFRTQLDRYHFERYVVDVAIAT